MTVHICRAKVPNEQQIRGSDPCTLEFARAKENPRAFGTSAVSSTAACWVGCDCQHCSLLPHRTGVTAVRLTCPRFEGRAVGCAAFGKWSGWETGKVSASVLVVGGEARGEEGDHHYGGRMLGAVASCTVKGPGT